MEKWLRDIVIILGVAASVTLSALAYHNSVKPDVPAPIITVVETTDPDMLTAKWIIGTQQIEIQNLVHLGEDLAYTVGLAMDRLVEEMRK